MIRVIIIVFLIFGAQRELLLIANTTVAQQLQAGQLFGIRFI